tara:strand:+ start:11705 stop:12037 length:333 start_codon:yes stop_codon:yes gene_type:complete
MNAGPNPHAETFRHPLLTLIYVGGLIWVTTYLLDRGEQGYPWGTPAAFVTGWMTITQVIRMLDDWAKLRHYRKRREVFKQSAKEHGQSSFGTIDDARQAGLVNHKGGQNE